MKYMLLIYGAESCWTEDERKKCMLESMGICEELDEEGKWIASSPLHSVTTATSVRVRDGKRQITDGPFAETIEQLGGYHIIEVDSGENTLAARLIRFTNVQEIVEMQSILKSYIQEAIESENAGVKVDCAKGRELDIPQELQDKFDEFPSLKTAFEALTPGRQRGYLLHFSGAKRASARVSRIEKYVQRILDGNGIHDCICGLSRKLPNCDGSHKQIQ